jgi:hypothetical protein
LKRIVLLLAVTAILVLALAVPAFAQGKSEQGPQGKVEQGPDHARSICSYSGLNDEVEEPAPEGGRVQSYGDYVKEDYEEPSGRDDPDDQDPVSDEDSPGFACNPNNISLK